MSVLSDKEIKARLIRPLSDIQSMRITPLLSEKFDHDSVDVHLGSYFRLPAISSVECVRPYLKGTVPHYTELIHKPYNRDRKKVSEGSEAVGNKTDESTLILQPQHAVLASTLEYIKMPGDVSAQILTKSSWARIFVSIASAPWIHPFYRGCLTLEITNLGNVAVALPVGKGIAHLVFMKLEGEIASNEDIIEGSYAGAIMPEAPIFK
jgi:deoxycytidine triphosphate deaminase